MVHRTSTVIPFWKRKSLLQNQGAGCVRSIKIIDSSAARQSCFLRIRGFASPGYPGFALIASTNYASCVESFFCDCMNYRYRTADMR